MRNKLAISRPSVGVDLNANDKFVHYFPVVLDNILCHSKSFVSMFFSFI